MPVTSSDLSQRNSGFSDEDTHLYALCLSENFPRHGEAECLEVLLRDRTRRFRQRRLHAVRHLQFVNGQLWLKTRRNLFRVNISTQGQANPDPREKNTCRDCCHDARTFDLDDIDDMESQGTFEGVILHEMGHVIGVG